METPPTIYASILVASGVALAGLSRIEPLRTWFRSLISLRLFWIPTVVIWGSLLWPQEQAEAFAAGAQIGLTRAIRVAIIAALFLFALLRLLLLRWVPPRSSLVLYGGYLVVCGLSVGYSPNPMETGWKTAELTVLLMLATLWLREASRIPSWRRQLLEGQLFLIATLVVTSMVGVLLYPELAFGIQDGTREISTASAAGIVPRVNANTLGQLAGITFAVGTVFMIERSGARRGGAVLVALGFVALVSAHSRTSLVAASVLPVGLLIVRRRWKELFAASGLIALGLIVNFGEWFAFFTRGQEAQLFSTMSGRTTIWSIAWASVREHPMLGLGFYAGHKTLPIADLVAIYSTVDNTFLEALVDVGIVGAAPLALFAWTNLARAIRQLRDPVAGLEGVVGRFGPIVLVGFVLVRAMTGPTFQALNINVTIILVAAVSLYRPRVHRADFRRGLSDTLGSPRASRQIRGINGSVQTSARVAR